MLRATSWDTTQARMAGPDRRSARRARATERRRRCWWPRNDRVTGAPDGARYDYLIVGAGFAGSVLAERLASQHGARVLLIDRRPHIGGNAYDELDEAGILYHKYGPHIFHTNSDAGGRLSVAVHRVAAVRARVLAEVRGQLVPIPINRTTLNKLFDARPRDRRGGRRLSRLARRAGRRHPDLRGRRHQRRRARALRAVLPRLHAQAMGPRPERARQVGDRAHPDPDQHRRPLFRRHASRPCRATATPRCSRRMLDQSADRRRARHRLSATSATRSTPTTSSTPARSTNISTSASASCPTAA